MSYYKKELKSSIERVPKSSVRMLWHHDYWDGPISGACLFNNDRLWYTCYDEGYGEDWYRKFVLLRLSDEKWKEIDFSHGMFQDYVGTHTDYDENGKRTIGADLKPRIEPNHNKFYSWFKENPLENIDGEQVATCQEPCDME